MSEMDRLEAIDKAVRDCARLATGKRTKHVNGVLSFKLSHEQLEEPWARELLHRRAMYVTALRESKAWP